MGKNVKMRRSYHGKKTNFKWAILMTLWTFVLSISIQWFSSGVMPKVHIIVAVLLLLTIILIGVLFDIVGVAVTVATEASFHALAARKMRGAKEAIMLIRNAERVANFCADVVGDICGVVSGSAAVIIVSKLMVWFRGTDVILALVMTGFVASFTVGSKAIGKGIAMHNANDIVYRVALLVSLFRRSGKDKLVKRSKQ